MFSLMNWSFLGLGLLNFYCLGFGVIVSWFMLDCFSLVSLMVCVDNFMGFSVIGGGVGGFMEIGVVFMGVSMKSCVLSYGFVWIGKKLVFFF